jgi:DNA polymerase-4
MRKIIHVDMDAFFVSVEIRDNPSLQGKPVAVGGSRVSRGVLSTCNYIAREYGVRSAMPTSVALRKCPGLILLPGRMHVYKEVSLKVRAIFERYTQLIEPLSLDEAYLDVSDCTLHQGSATLIAQDICQTIQRELNLTASAGVAPIKFLAKVASEINKPNGIYVIKPKDVDAFIDTMPLNKIPGVGKVTFEKLRQYQLVYGKDIKACDKAWLIEQFGKLGELLWLRCQGVDERAVVTARIRKSVGVETTFPTDIDDLARLKSILVDSLLPELKTRAARHLLTRSIQKIGIKVKFNDFHQTTKEFTFHHFDENLFAELLIEALARGKGKKVRLLGAHLGLSHESSKAEQYAFSW